MVKALVAGTLLAAITATPASAAWEALHDRGGPVGARACSGGFDRVCFGLTCSPQGDLSLVLIEQTRAAPRALDAEVRVNGQPVSVLSLAPRGDASAAPYEVAKHAALIQRVREGEDLEIRFAGETVAFPLEGAADALASTLRLCRGDPDVAPAFAGGTPPAAEDPAPPGSPAAGGPFARLVESIRAELEDFCARGETVVLQDGTISGGPGSQRVIADLGMATCRWEFTNHPFCGARLCSVRTYALEGGEYRLTEEVLR